jgi:hypothetical protein
MDGGRENSVNVGCKIAHDFRKGEVFAVPEGQIETFGQVFNKLEFLYKDCYLY